MTDTEFVDALTQFWENVGSAETAADAAVQARNTFLAQRAVSRFWHRYHWPIKERSDVSVTLTNGDGDLPDDFGAFGQNGGVFLPNNNGELDWRPSRTLIRMRELSGTGTTTRPLYYTVRSIAGMNVGTPLLSVYPSYSGDVRCYYDAKAPTVDYAGPGFALDQIPVQWHETILFPLACSYLAFAEGDPRAKQLEAEAFQAMAEAWAEENPAQATARRRGPAYGRTYTRGYM